MHMRAAHVCLQSIPNYFDFLCDFLAIVHGKTKWWFYDYLVSRDLRHTCFFIYFYLFLFEMVALIYILLLCYPTYSLVWVPPGFLGSVVFYHTYATLYAMFSFFWIYVLLPAIFERLVRTRIRFEEKFIDIYLLIFPFPDHYTYCCYISTYYYVSITIATYLGLIR